jgi:hypothetical protein
LTVLTYRAGIIAADRRVMYDDTQRQAPMCKLALGKSHEYKFVVAAAGNSDSEEQTLDLAKQVLDDLKKPAWKGDLLLLIAAVPLRRRKPRLIVLDYAPKSSALVSYVGKNIPEYLALGSGADAALGSLRNGATAIKAVKDASAHVTTCGDGLNFVDTTLPIEKWRVRQRKT